MKKILLIALLLLSFNGLAQIFTYDNDKGINRTLPPQESDQTEDVKVNEKNIIKVYVNRDNMIMVNGKICDIADLTKTVKKHITPTPNDANAPETTTKNIDLLGDITVSKAIVSLRNDKQTSYETYIAVQSALTKAYNELRDEMSMKYFKKHYSNLSEKEAKAIDNAVPMRISEAEPEDVK